MRHNYVKQSITGAAQCGTEREILNITQCSTYFGLADLGFGCPEMGYFSLTELSAIRLPYGLFIERDVAFDSQHPLSVWAAWSRRAGSTLWAQTLLRRASETGELPELPQRSDDPNGG